MTVRRVMFGSSILDVATGVVFLFLLLSLICSAVNELIEGYLKNRAADLERGIGELFADPAAVVNLYKHQLISGLYRGTYEDAKKNRKLPTYIPSRTFVLALMDGLQPATTDRQSGAAGTVPPPGPATTPQTTAGAQPATENPIKAFRGTLAAMDAGSPIRKALLPLVDAAGNDAATARANIEDWFNSSMDRVSGWYKRRTQIIVAVLGFVLAAVFNADAIGFARYLSTDKDARAMIVSQAGIMQKDDATAGTAGSPPPRLVDSLQWLDSKSGIPFGWSPKPTGANDSSNKAFTDWKLDWRRVPDSFPEWLVKIFGLLLTAAAVSLGAPFWFDVLNKFMVVRSTIKPKEKSPEEPSKA
ncbi:MAG: hypothetical protein JWO66_1523 [Candidatus Eremiobacteraeota bacterium]|nr:hypothetical protein [Candidatus Eremiobacteraeota bacterium]